MAEPKAVARTKASLVAPERSAGERSEPARSGGATNGASAPGVVREDVEVQEKAKRRRFDAQYKLAILAEADACPPGGIGALLRREGLYSSHLITWRRQRDAGVLAGLQPKRRGPKPRVLRAESRRIKQLERENEKLRHRLQQAETIIEFQKKVHEILGIPLKDPPLDDETS
jgi:transposase-like protein